MSYRIPSRYTEAAFQTMEKEKKKVELLYCPETMKVQPEVVFTTVNEIALAPNNNTYNNAILHPINEKLAG